MQGQVTMGIYNLDLAVFLPAESIAHVSCVSIISDLLLGLLRLIALLLRNDLAFFVDDAFL